MKNERIELTNKNLSSFLEMKKQNKSKIRNIIQVGGGKKFCDNAGIVLPLPKPSHP